MWFLVFMAGNSLKVSTESLIVASNTSFAQQEELKHRIKNEKQNGTTLIKIKRTELLSTSKMVAFFSDR